MVAALKNLKRIIVLTLCCAVMASLCAAVEVSAKSAILYETSTGRILFCKEMETERPIASTTKIMTAVLVLEHAKLEDVVTVKEKCTGIEGTSIYLQPGEKITVKNLLYGMMLKSGNDAAVTLADYVGGNVPNFVKMMNTRAKEIGMSHTQFINPNGLPAEGHYSTALDMAKLTAFAMSIPEFKEIVSSKSYAASGRSFTNHNRLLKMREDIDGVKTGFTKAAGRCLVSSAVRDGMRLVAVTLFDPDDWDDHLTLYDFGFKNFGRLAYVRAGDVVCSVPVAGSGLTVNGVAEGELIQVAPREELEGMQFEVVVPKFCYAPVAVGDKIGELHITKEGKVIAKTAIIAQDAVSMPQKLGMWDYIMRLFGIKSN